MDQNESTGTVWMNYRFAAAWHEVNARIAQRQNALNIFVTLATGIVAIMLTAGQSTAATPGLNLIRPDVFSLLLPIVSLCFGMLNYKHDKTIALLRDYLSNCEIFTESGKALPGYNSSPSYAGHAESTRKFHDWACAIILLLFNAIGLVAAKNAYPEEFTVTRWPIVCYFVLVGFSLLLVMRSTWRPHKFSSQEASMNHRT